MTARFTVLASGSGGNTSLLESGGFGLLLDLGLNAKQLGARLAMRRHSWQSVHAAVLTHTHSDHWHESALSKLAKFGLPLYCHADHVAYLRENSPAFGRLDGSGLVRRFEIGQWHQFGPNLRAKPLAVSHDCGATFGFRFEGSAGLFGSNWAIGYAADLGTWDQTTVADLADVDLLAIEFNHDEAMQRTSGRPKQLIQRVLSDRGHLSNRQAATLLRAIRKHSRDDCLRILVALHRSRECNRPELALEAARAECGEAIRVWLADQFEPSVVFRLSGDRGSNRTSVQPKTRRPAAGVSTPRRVT